MHFICSPIACHAIFRAYLVPPKQMWYFPSVRHGVHSDRWLRRAFRLLCSSQSILSTGQLLPHRHSRESQWRGLPAQAARDRHSAVLRLRLVELLPTTGWSALSAPLRWARQSRNWTLSAKEFRRNRSHLKLFVPTLHACAAAKFADSSFS